MRMNLFRWLRDENREPVVHIPDTPHTPPVRMRYRFFGFVQGVGFRFEAVMTARKLKLTGWARNEDDRSVTVEIQGEMSYIEEFLRVMQAVPRFRITDIQTEELPLSHDETTFDTQY